jgi:hypothetical protein
VKSFSSSMVGWLDQGLISGIGVHSLIRANST